MDITKAFVQVTAASACLWYGVAAARCICMLVRPSAPKQ